MGTKKISELTQTTALNSNDVLPVVDVTNTSTKKITAGTLAGIFAGATAFSSSSNYAIGDYCIYNNILYKAKVTVTSGSNFNSANWASTTVLDEIKDKSNWVLIKGDSNSTSSEKTTTITTSDIYKYTEFLLTVGTTAAPNRVLASTTIPKSVLNGTDSNGYHQACYIDSSANRYRTGISFDESNNSMTVYMSANVSVRVYAR